MSLPGDITNEDEQNGLRLLVNNAGIARDDSKKYSNGTPDFKRMPFQKHERQIRGKKLMFS
jgi:hypothetical protein